VTPPFEPLVFDGPALDRRTGFDPALRADVITMFLEDCPTYLSVIRSAVANGDAAALLSAAHTLKGAAAYVSGGAVAGLAARLEGCGRDGRAAEAVDELAALEAAVAQLLPYLA
jgi:HPt (histidine-containing phosphotransfer) domain-containing protein